MSPYRDLQRPTREQIAGLSGTLANISRKNLLAYLLDIGVDGVITDYPHEFRRTLSKAGYKLAPQADYHRVKGCLRKHNQYTENTLDGWGYVHSK